MTLVLHCGAESATYEDLGKVTMPRVTRSYQPLAHTDMVDMLADSVLNSFGKDTVTEVGMGLTKDGARMFGMMKLKMDSDEHDISIGFRNSLDKCFSAGIITGARMLVCDNLCFSGSGVNLFRKHTTNIYRDIVPLIDNAITLSKSEYKVITDNWDKMKDIPLSLDEGYRAIGLAQGHKVLSPTQSSIAYAEWLKPSHVEFEERNVFALQQSFTEAAKKGSPEGMMRRYPRINRFFGSEWNLAA